MSLPIASTRISVLRPPVDPTRDPYDDPPPVYSPVATGVRAHISLSGGEAVEAGGEQAISMFRLLCDPVDMQHTDRIKDETSGDEYLIIWTEPRPGYRGQLGHRVAQLRQVQGLASGRGFFGPGFGT